jgi:8-amino-7-oxononanoate synthase
MQTLQKRLDVLASQNRLRALRPHENDLLDFCSNDYLGLSRHPQVLQAAQQALLTFGAGAGASRLVSGNHPLYRQLESRLSDYKKSQAALVFGSGYHANMGVLGNLPQKGDVILSDKLIHASMLDGIRLSHATHKRFRHNDMEHLRQFLHTGCSDGADIYIVTESVFSMDGDCAPLEDLLRIAQEYDAWLVVDDAHGLGVTADGKGAFASYETLPKRVILTGTFSKAVGGYGGYVCATQNIIDMLVNTARPLIYSTGLPPSVIAGNLAALEIIFTQPEMCRKPLKVANLFCELLRLSPASSAIVPLIIGEESAALATAEDLRGQGYHVIAIRPPTVPEGTSRLRVTFSAQHSEAQVKQLAGAIKHAAWFKQ